MGMLELEVDQGVSRYLSGDGVSIHVGVDSNHNAGSYCHAEDSHANATKIIHHVHATLQGERGNVADGVVDGVSTVDCLPHPL